MTIDDYIQVLKNIQKEWSNPDEDLTLEKWKEIFSMSVDMIGFIEKIGKLTGGTDMLAEFRKAL